MSDRLLLVVAFVCVLAFTSLMVGTLGVVVWRLLRSLLGV